MCFVAETVFRKDLQELQDFSDVLRQGYSMLQGFHAFLSLQTFRSEADKKVGNISIASEIM